MSDKRDRIERIGEQIHCELVEIFSGDLADPRFESVTVTRVALSRDLGQAKVYFSASDDDLKSTDLESLLDRAGGFFRTALAERLPLRRIPQLQFKVDQGVKNVERVTTLLNRISKRQKVFYWIIGPALLLNGSLCATAAEQPTPFKRYEASMSAMGTKFTAAVYGKNLGFIASVVESAFEEVGHADAMLNHYQPDSELSRINRNAAKFPWEISEPMGNLLERCIRYSQLSQGGFDITVGPLMRLWGFHRGSGHVPNPEEIKQTLEVVDYRLVELDRMRGTIQFLRQGVELDPGAMGKGYAVDRMVDIFREAGLESFFISGGNSSLYAGKAPPSDNQGWKISVRGQDKNSKPVEELYLEQASFSTSGSYEKFFELENKRYSHLMNPHTGYPVAGITSVSVIAPTAFASEIWSTALFVNGLEWTLHNKPDGLKVLLCATTKPCKWIE